jgi:hypothetical protein
VGAAQEAQAACPAEQAAEIASEIGKPPDRPPGPEERSVDPAPVEGRGLAVREVPPALAALGAAVPAAAGEDAAERAAENRD